MSFANITKPKSFFSDIKKILYLNLDSGTRVIRILQGNAVSFDVHWVNRTSFKCPGEGCPVCENNYKLYVENKETKGAWRNQPQWSPARKTFLVNVLDRTVVKVCPKCGVDVYKSGTVYPEVCPACNTFVNTVVPAPSNKVKVLSRGVTLFDRLNGLANSVLDENQEPIPLTSYDISLIISGTGTQKDIMPMPMMNKMDMVSVPEEQLFDLSLAIPELTIDEIRELQRGVQMRDIFLARKATDGTAPEKVIEVNDDIKKKIDELFGPE